MSLTIGVRFLTGYCVTAQSKTDPKPEWPPHPARLFMALAAAYFECCGADGAERNALLWLEGLGPPVIRFSPRALPDNTAVATFVPMNDSRAVSRGGSIQSVPTLKRHRAERLFPRTHLPEDEDCVYVTWEDAAGDAQVHRDALGRLCGYVGRLGHSSSLVQVFIAAGPGEGLAVWEAGDAGVAALRVIHNTTGTLDRLTAAFTLPPHRPSVKTYCSYRPRSPRPPAHVTTVFDERMVILRLEPAPPESRWLELATTLALTSTLRKAILGRCSTPIPESISGHSAEGGASQQPHMALVPLGFVDHTYADGHLLGVGVVLPRGADKTVERQLAEALERLADSGEQYGEGLGFDRKAFPGLGQWRLIQEGPLSEFRSNLRANTWTAAERGGCMRWASVTPVGYDQHGKAKDRAAYLAECSASIQEAVRRVILTEINVAVRITPVSAFEGVPAARDFPRMTRKDGSERRQTHVELFFDRPVVGPLLIGAGRFRGYGLCRPCNGEDE